MQSPKNASALAGLAAKAGAPPPAEARWCRECRVPVIQAASQADAGVCPACGGPLKPLAADLRPVFPEERLLLEALLKSERGALEASSVWATNGRYYIEGKPLSLPSGVYRQADTDKIAEELKARKGAASYFHFDESARRFVNANRMRLSCLKDEAASFIQEAASGFPEENIVVSFSGGKDSTAVADLAAKALSNPSLVHIFGDTTLEFPLTLEYASRFRASHPEAVFQVARNSEQSFLDVCEDIGPPARMMRWCCSMFKTGPISRVISSLYRDEQILTFYGIRKQESVARSKYNRIEGSADSIKIRQQTVASPIFFWKDIDVWLYILSEGLDFNDAYRLGYSRVGCWCCPNNNSRDEFLSKIYMPEQSKRWRKFLVEFALRIGKSDPEVYVDTGKWKARQGGNGLAAADDVKIKFANCTSEENAKIYRLARPFSDELVGMFVPFGKIAPEMGQRLLRETVVLDCKTNVPILSVQPYSQDGHESAVKVRALNVADAEGLQRMAGYQIRKFNACRKCLKCESLCKAGAISVNRFGYFIDPQKCVHCKLCVSAKHIEGGCMMEKYLRTK